MVLIARKSHFKLAALAAVAGLTSFGLAAHAGTFVWNSGGGADTNWTTPSNWVTNSGFPGSGDSAQWTGATPTTSTVLLPGNQAASDIQINNRVVQFNLNNFTLAVGAVQSDVDGDSSNVTFHGAGNVTFGALFRLGFNGTTATPTHVTVTANGGAQVSTLAMTLGDYGTGALVNVTGAGTVWNSGGNVQFGRNVAAGTTPTEPREQLLITQGGVFNHNLGTTNANMNTFIMARHDNSDAYVQVDGAGSQFNLTGTYSSAFQVGGYNSNVKFDITNGGLFNSPTSLGLSFANTGTGVNTFNINGTNSRMLGTYMTLGGRSNADAARGATVINVGTGGLLQATSFDGNDIGIGVGSRGLLSLQGGSVSVPANKSVTLLTAGALVGIKSTLNGFGTISSGNLIAQQDSRITPGVSGAGTINITSGNLTTAAGTTPTELDFDLQTTSGNPHDLIALHSATSTATIGNNSTSAITYSVLGGGTLASGASGFMDFLIGETVQYGGTTLLGDVPSIDNLPALLTAAGYTRVSGATTPGAGQYSYFLTTVGAADYAGTDVGEQALRLQFAPPVTVPEPASLALLGLGGMLLLRRRRS